jgi:hypothetical protein
MEARLFLSPFMHIRDQFINSEVCLTLVLIDTTTTLIMYKSYILIAEDDAYDRFLLETAFTECGLKDKLIFVENGIELIQFLEQERHRNGVDRKFPAFIMMDLNMPKKDGREA